MPRDELGLHLLATEFQRRRDADTLTGDDAKAHLALGKFPESVRRCIA